MGTIVATNLLTGVLVGIGLSLLRVLWKVTHLETHVEEKDDMTEVHFSGIGTFLAIPKITAALDQVSVDKPVVVHTHSLRYVDHACIEVIESWVERRQERGSIVHLEVEMLHRRYHTPVSRSVA